MKRKRLTVVETSVLAHRSSDTLCSYSDGSLPERQRADVDKHLRVCAACRQTVNEMRRLELVLQDFPPAPSVPFPRFWSRLEARLPNPSDERIAFVRPRLLAAGLALAIGASLVGVVALASDETLPDSPLYSVKHVRQGLQLSLISARGRPSFEVTLGKQRLHEAAVMLERRRDDLAVASLKDLSTLLLDAARVQKVTGDQPETAHVTQSIAQIKIDLAVVRAANLEPDGSSAAEIGAVDDAVQHANNAVAKVQTQIDATAAVVESPAQSKVSAVPPAPEVTAAPSDANGQGSEPSPAE